MIGLLQKGLRSVFEALEIALDRVFTPKFNPFGQLGALGYFFFWIVAGTGIYLFAVFDTGVHKAFASVEWFSNAQWWHAGFMRSFHRYGSDILVAVMLLHLVREFSLDRFRGTRWFSWFTGVPLIVFLYVSGITGYWLVWDKLAQYVATTSTELLDALPIFGEPIARNFLDRTSLSDRFFTLLVFLHIAVPLILLFGMWIHIQRISRPRVNPPRALAVMMLIALVLVSAWKPAISQGAADLAVVPSPVNLDGWYLFLYPLADRAPKLVWILMALGGLLLAAVPLLPARRRPRPAVVDLAHCNGCARCIADCPYEALRLVPRTDGAPYHTQVVVDEDKCVSCGICVGSCPSSTPFRRTEDLVTGIDLPDSSLTWVRQQTVDVCAADTSSPKILVIACGHGAGALHNGATLSLSCVAMAPPSLIDYVLSRGLADGVVISGCSERACHHRLGVEWTQQRFAQERDPYLRSRVPRERILQVWASGAESGRWRREVEAFRVRLAGLEKVVVAAEQDEPVIEDVL